MPLKMANTGPKSKTISMLTIYRREIMILPIFLCFVYFIIVPIGENISKNIKEKNEGGVISSWYK